MQRSGVATRRGTRIKTKSAQPRRNDNPLLLPNTPTDGSSLPTTPPRIGSGHRRSGSGPGFPPRATRPLRARAPSRNPVLLCAPTTTTTMMIILVYYVEPVFRLYQCGLSGGRRRRAGPVSASRFLRGVSGTTGFGFVGGRRRRRQCTVFN